MKLTLQKITFVTPMSKDGIYAINIQEFLTIIHKYLKIIFHTL